jgi:thiamine biosynthesis lipoprotein
MAVADWPALGTTAELVVSDPEQMDAARAAVELRLDAIDRAASRFRPDSELSRLNAAGGNWMSVSALFAQALRVALDAAEWTGGVVDPTVGASLLDLGYDRTFASVPADGPPLTVMLRAAPGWRDLELDDSGPRARLSPGTLLDLGATAKGLAADLCAHGAADAAGCGVLVSLGGDVAVAGPAPAAGWPIAVSDRSDLSLSVDDGPTQVVTIHSGALATSSTTARRWRRGGSLVHHLIDPSSGRPAEGPWRTVSVTAVTCALANAASTAAVILGDAAPGWLRDHGMHARLVRIDGSVTYAGDWPRADVDGGATA